MSDRHYCLIVTLCGVLAACGSPDVAYLKRLHAALDPLIGQNIQVAIAKLGPPASHADSEHERTYIWRFNKGVALPADAVVPPPALDLCTLALRTNLSDAITNANLTAGLPCEPVFKRLTE